MNSQFTFVQRKTCEFVHGCENQSILFSCENKKQYCCSSHSRASQTDYIVLYQNARFCPACKSYLQCECSVKVEEEVYIIRKSYFEMPSLA